MGHAYIVNDTQRAVRIEEFCQRQIEWLTIMWLQYCIQMRWIVSSLTRKLTPFVQLEEFIVDAIETTTGCLLQRNYKIESYKSGLFVLKYIFFRLINSF